MGRKIQSPFELDKSDVEVLSEKAKETQRTKSSIVRQLIRDHLQEI